MHELLAQVRAAARGMWRFRWAGVAVAWLVAIAATVAIFRIPDRYEGSARIYVDTQSILKPLMSGLAIQPNVEQQVAMLSRTLLTRPTLEKLVRMADLDLGLTTKEQQDALIDDLLDGRRPTLQAMALDTEGAKAVYALWGYYVASGQHEPVVRIMQALQWSKGAQKKGFFGKLASGWGADANNVEKVTTGGTAKWTLASYAERDRELIRLYQAELKNQPEEIAEPLKDVIEAAELFEAEKIRKEQYGAIEDAERQQFTADAGMSKGWTAGSIAIATGCMAASALGQAQIAVPCVIGGALYSGEGKLAR